jgi:hypothetical protein
MPKPTKHGMSLVAWASVHGCHPSLLARMSAQGEDITSIQAVQAWIKRNGREKTRYFEGIKAPPPVQAPKPQISAPSTVAHLKRVPRPKTASEIQEISAARKRFIDEMTPERRRAFGIEQEIEKWINEP